MCLVFLNTHVLNTKEGPLALNTPGCVACGPVRTEAGRSRPNSGLGKPRGSPTSIPFSRSDPELTRCRSGSITPNRLPETDQEGRTARPARPACRPPVAARAAVSHQIQVESNELQPRHQGQEESQVIVTADQGIPARHEEGRWLPAWPRPPWQAVCVETGHGTSPPSGGHPAWGRLQSPLCCSPPGSGAAQHFPATVLRHGVCGTRLI